MKTKRNRIYRSTIAAIAASALALPALAGDAKHHEAQTWEGQAYDAWVDGKIEASYTLNRYLNPFEIDTDVNQGVVYLTGEVDSQVEKDLAEEIALGIEGVTEVRNELAVRPEMDREVAQAPDFDDEDAMDLEIEAAGDDDFGDHFEDATTTARVKFALLANDSTEGLRINVDTEDGTVVLNGEVDSAEERELAERVAMNTEGVTAVENRLKVAGQS